MAVVAACSLVAGEPSPLLGSGPFAALFVWLRLVLSSVIPDLVAGGREVSPASLLGHQPVARCRGFADGGHGGDALPTWGAVVAGY